MICLILLFNLLIWPTPGLAREVAERASSAAISTTVTVTTGSMRIVSYLLKALFGSQTARRKDTPADRERAVASLRVNPNKLVGHENEGATFTSLPTDLLGNTVQGIKANWSSSDTRKIQIDEAGRARFLAPGLAWITCTVGSITGTAPVLVRSNHRTRQTDEEWRTDQATLRPDGTLIGDGRQPSSDGSLKRVAAAVSSVLDKLAPTAFAQGPPYSDDLCYDELWSDPRNLVGSPRDRAAEAMAFGSVLPEGSNFAWGVPIYGLGGRGLAANLMLHYNSRVWSRRGTTMAYDAISGWPAPGFSLGFGRIVPYEIGSGQNPTCKYLLIERDGTRRYLGSGLYNGTGYALGGPFETSDGSHIVYTGNGRDGGDLHYPDGTTVSYTTTNNRALPTTITDRNGNYVQISYKPDCFEQGGQMYCGYFAPIAIDYVVDTLGRRLEFQYDSNYRLVAITAPGFGGNVENPVTNTLVQFDYQTVTPSYSFTGLTVERPASSFRLKHIYFPATSTGYLPTYTQYAVITSVSARRQMTSTSWPPGNPPSITDGVETATVSFNYPTSGTLSDAPAFTQRTETAVNSPTAVSNYSTSTNGFLQTMTFTITRPDSTTVELTRSTNGSSPANGRLIQSEVKYSDASLAKTVLTYVNDGGGSPQVQSVISYDDTGAPVKLDFDWDQDGNITNKREYGYQASGVWQVRRRTHFTYFMSTLRSLVEVYDALLNTTDGDDVLIAKSSYAYDNYISMGGIETYGGANPPGHLSWYDATFTTRGNVTGVTQWTDIAGGTVIQRLAKYDVFGNVVKAQLSCCQERDLTNTLDTFWSQPETEISGDPNGVHQTTSTDYDFNTSLPTSGIDPAGLVANIGYNGALQVSSVTSPTGASAQRNMNYASLTSTSTQTYEDGVVTKTITSTTQYDGWGRVIQAIAPNNGQVNIAYDAMGRVTSRTNPFTAGGTPGPATTIQYDIANKAVITTLANGNTTRSDSLGDAVTITDQVNRKIKREADGLGRLTKVTEQDSSGALAQETTYGYSLLDKLAQVSQGNQLRSYKYDALGRLLYEKIPEQSATINDGTGNYWSCKYTYTEFSSVSTKQDARGVVSTYSYDALHRATGISYNTVSGVATAPSVTYIHDSDVTYGTSAPGKLVRVNVGSDYQERYTFDDNLRVSSTIRTIGTRTYTTSYNSYNEASQLTQMTYPSSRQLTFSYDSIGRPSTVAGYLSNVAYNIAGLVIGGTLGNGVVEQVGYDTNRLQLTSQKAGTTSPYTNRMDLTYNYNATAGQMGAGSTAGNAGQLMSISGTINSTTESAAYTYDLLGRLVTSNQTSNASSAQRLFDYDRWGNRTAVYDGLPGGKTPPTQIQSVAFQQGGSAPTNRIGSVTNYSSTVNYTYDAAGNVTNDGFHSYTYDSANRLVSVDSGATASHAYDHQNRRYKKTVGSSVTHYVWDGAQVIAEHNGGTGVVLVDYIYSGSRMIAKVESGTTNYFLSDRLSARLMLNTSGVVVGRQSHLPFGEVFGEIGPQEKHHLTSYERDTESGLDYAINREYAFTVGRFLQSDPYRAHGSVFDPQSWNRYSYTRGDPINKTDRVGLDWTDDLWALLTAVKYSVNVNGGDSYQGGGGDEMLRVEEVVVNPGVGQELPGGVSGTVPIVRAPLPPLPQEYLKLINDAIMLALAALGNPKCASLFHLPDGLGPGLLLAELWLGSNRGGITAAPSDDATTVASTRLMDNYSMGPSGTLAHMGFISGTAVITINTNPQSPFVSNTGYQGRFGVDDGVNRAITLIHELGHAANAMFGPFTAEISEIDTPASNPIFRFANTEYSKRVFKRCFGGN
ncbi:MAG: RHS repeat-associated core domain-containing protein [Acidobacteriota bacterium]